MQQQIIATPSTKTIIDVYRRVKENSLILQPAFQRRFVWNKRHKERFIDTILSGYPTPEIYIAQNGIDIDKIESEEVVVDGQQRLSTIMEYIEEKSDSKTYGDFVPKYINLTDEQKRGFLNYLLIFRDLGNITSEQIIEVFQRINSTQYSLNAVELHNAIYDGVFIDTAHKIVSMINLDDLPFLSESQITRMEDLYFILLIMSTIEEGGYFSRDTIIEKMIAQYNDEYPRAEQIKTDILNTYQYIKKINLSYDSIWLKKSSYFTMFVELYKILPLVNGLETKVKELLVKTEFEVIQNKTNDIETNEFARFYSYTFTGTNSRKARVERADFFYNIINKIIE